MKIKILLIVLFACAICSGQTSDMELPAYDGDYRSVSTPYYPIYILKTEEIILFNDTISPADLSKALYKGIPNYGSSFMIPKAQVHLIIDKDVAYETVDMVKSQSASTTASKLYFYYRASDEKRISSRVKAIRYPNHSSFFILNIPEHMLTQSDLIKRDSIKNTIPSELPVPPRPYLLNTIRTVEQAIYSVQQNAIDEVLNAKNCISLTLKSDGLYRGAGNRTALLEAEAIFDLFSKYDLVLLKFDKDLLYQDYFNYLIVLEAIQDRLKKVEIIELSKEITEIHKDAGIRLPCDD